TYPITLSGGTDNNYTITTVNGTLTVNKAALTATADNKSRLYGDANPALTITYSGFKNNETSSVIDTPPVAATTATATSNVGTYPITLTSGTDNNYTITPTNGTLTVNKATLTATADNKTKAYGDANPALTISYSGFKNSETASVIDTAPTVTTTATTASSAGTYPITVSGGTDNNYAFTYASGTLTVTRAIVTATADNKSRLYGDSNPVLTISYSGFRNGDNETTLDALPAAATAATPVSNAGTYPITLSGGSDNNYTLTLVNGTLTVNKATLTATADNASRAYGEANPVFTVTYSGFKNSETASVIDTPPAAASIATLTSNTGSYPITLSGGTDNNYIFTLSGGTLTVTKATLTATADNKSRGYGEANPVFTVTYSGFKNNETASVIDTPPSGSTTAVSASPVGTYPINLTGGSDNNYTITNAAGTLTINKAILTAKADDLSRPYNTDNPALTVSYSGFKNNETSAVIDTPPAATTTATKTSLPGTYPITLSGGSDNNYTISLQNGSLVVTKLSQTVTFTLPAVLYHDQSPYTLSATSTSNGPITFSVVSGSATVSGNLLTITGSGTLTVKAAQPGTEIYLAADVNATTNVGNSYVVSGLITKPVNIPLGTGIAKLFYEQGGLAKNGTVTNGNYSIALVRPGKYVLQVVPTGNEESGVFPAYYNAAILNKDATVIDVQGNVTISMELPGKPSNDPKGQGEIKGKVVGGNGGGRFIVGRIADGTGLPNVPVYLLDTSDKVLKTVNTDKDGLFSFTELVTGSYKLALDVVGASLASSSTTINVDPAKGILEVSASVTTVNNQPVVGLQVQVITGLEGNEVFLSAYPNPADEELRLTWRSNSEAAISVTLSDLNGKVMKKQSHETNGASGGEIV
ncbi:MAG: MBG domain-containing protein, partial [Bacteroidota bacterium]